MFYVYLLCGYWVGLSWCDSVLCANQLILLWVNFCVGEYMYYIGAIVSSHDGACFFLGGKRVHGVDMFF